MPSEEILLKSLEMAWQDHFQTRTQTWRTLEIEVALAVALIGIDWRLDSIFATSAVAFLLIIAALFGALITIRHRNQVEVTKFLHITNIEKKLGLLELDLLANVKKPEPIKWKDIFSFKSNTSLFILRMHIILQAFGLIYLIFRWL